MHVHFTSIWMKQSTCLKNSPFHIVSFSETWLDSTIPNECVNMSGYTTVRKDRNRRGGGIIIIYVKNYFFFSRLEIRKDEELELIVLQIELHKQKPFILCIWYHPPNSPISSFDRISQVFQKIEATGLDVLVMGDLNCDFLRLKLKSIRWASFFINQRFQYDPNLSATTN